MSLLQTKVNLGDHHGHNQAHRSHQAHSHLKGGMDPKPDGGAADCESDVGEVHSFTVDGVTRCFNLVTPASAAKPMPVVVYFHGKGGAANKGCHSKTEITKA